MTYSRKPRKISLESLSKASGQLEDTQLERWCKAQADKSRNLKMCMDGVQEKENEKLEEMRLEGRRNAEAARRYEQLALLLRRKRLGEGMRWLRKAATAPLGEHPVM